MFLRYNIYLVKSIDHLNKKGSNSGVDYILEIFIMYRGVTWASWFD